MTKLSRLIYLYFNTIKYLKLIQIFYRFKNKLIKNKPREVVFKIRNQKNSNWIKHYIYDEKLSENGESYFLNTKKNINLPESWNDKNEPKLWLYNLHYFDDLMAFNSDSKRLFHKELINSWIKNNHYHSSIGWDPYPTSLRVVNIIKAHLNGFDLDHKILKSVALQLDYLSKRKEKHILGNHYFSNLKALFFGGLFLDGKKPKKWLSNSITELEFQIHEQILADGSHFELSPMYHALILIDMLDIYNISNSYEKHVPQKFKILVRDKIEKMIDFYFTMLHPDGGLSYFNDSVNEIAPSEQMIVEYANKLGINSNIKGLHSQDIIVFDHKSSGYMVALNNEFKLIFDAGDVGPDYIPGHAHADTLSFELSILNERVFVNSGISNYILGNLRHHQRSTKSHNTVEIDNRNSSDVWHNFRVANRAKVIKRNVEKKHKTVLFEAEHNGYKSFFNGCIHKRSIKIGDNKIRILDSIQGNNKNAISRLFLHPKLKVNCIDNQIFIEGSKFFLKLKIECASYEIKDTFWNESFNKLIPNMCIEIKINNNQCSINGEWKLKN